MEDELIQAICLRCNHNLPVLSKGESGLYTCECETVIPYKYGIYQFVPGDDFYEGRFVTTYRQSGLCQKLQHTVIRLFSIDGSEERMWHKAIKFIRRRTKSKSLDILDTGSGGGHAFLGALGYVTAIDLSLQSLLNAQDIYDCCYQADAREIPFPDESFDLVFSAHLLGHIPLENKQTVVKEIYRVTKPGGFSLHSAECEANNFIYRRARKYTDLYVKYFKDGYGHYGIEFPSACKKRFRDEGFQPIYELSDYCKGVIRPMNSYKVFFMAKEFREKERIFNVLTTISEKLSSNKLLGITSGMMLYPLTALNRLYGPDSVDSVKLLYQKPG